MRGSLVLWRWGSVAHGRFLSSFEAKVSNGTRRLRDERDADLAGTRVSRLAAVVATVVVTVALVNAVSKEDGASACSQAPSFAGMPTSVRCP